MLNRFNFFSPFFSHFSLIWTMSKRDILVRYKGSAMGVLWSFINPLIMLGIYTFVFQYVFKAKWGSEREVTANFSAILFSGLLLHMWLGEVATRAVNLVNANVNYVKKVVFPLEILGWNILISSFAQFVAGTTILVVFLLFTQHYISISLLFAPLVLVSFLLFLIGFVYLLAALGVFIRDLEQVVQALITVLLFTSTIFFPIEMVPSFLKGIIKFNPLTIPVESLRSLLFGLSPLNINDILIYSAVCFVFAGIGYYIFGKLKTSFADVV